MRARLVQHPDRHYDKLRKMENDMRQRDMSYENAKGKKLLQRKTNKTTKHGIRAMKLGNVIAEHSRHKLIQLIRIKQIKRKKVIKKLESYKWNCELIYLCF